MTGPYASLNGELLPVEAAKVAVDDVDVVYGYGVYETLKVRNRVLYFPELHEERLLRSAEIVGIPHPFPRGRIRDWIESLVRANRPENANVKVLLFGGESPASARLYAMTLNPLFPDRRDLRHGATAVVFEGERLYPEAKTLNMLMSSIAFRKAKAAGAYDAVLKDRYGNLTEGTRTNLFFTDGERIFTPPKDTVLAGVTKITVERVVGEAGIPMEERVLPEADLGRWAGIFLTSTSTKIMPLRMVGETEFAIPDIVPRIAKLYDRFLDSWAAERGPLF